MPFNYLGVKVGCRHRKVNDWDYVLEKVKSRLSKWNNLKVSLGGRITLIKAVLSALPTYVLSIYRAPLRVLKKLVALQQSFLWGGRGVGNKMVWAKWESISVPKLYGGLGMKDLGCFNKALLGKWAWRAIGSEDLLWVDIVKGLVGWEGCRDGGLELFLGGLRTRGWWRDVLVSLLDDKGGWFLDSISRKVGNGFSTRFWEDVWVGESNFKSLFPRLYDICLGKGCSVNEAGGWVEDRWAWRVGWRRDLRSWESDAMSSLLALLECRKQVVNVPDSWEWNPESKGCYSVKSAYKLLLARKLEFNSDVKSVCKLLWNNFAAPKAQATAWRILFRRIATRVELRRRGVLDANMDVVCPLCKETDETIKHLFVECSQSSALWKSCLNWSRIEAPLSNDPSTNLLHFGNLGASKRNRVFLTSLWVCTMWMIWNARNECVFNNGDWNLERILGKIKAFLWNWGCGKNLLWGVNSSFSDWCADPQLDSS